MEAFSHRAQATRQRIELPATPSSSHETLDPTPIAPKPIKILEEKLPETTPPVEIPIKTNVFSYLHHNFIKKEIDPQGKLYVIWMCIAAMAVLYNVFFIPLRSTFPYQTPNNRAAWMFFDYSADLIYILDMVLIQPRIMFLSDGFFVKDINFTKQNYLRNAHFKVRGLTVTLFPTRWQHLNCFMVRILFLIEIERKIFVHRVRHRFKALFTCFMTYEHLAKSNCIIRISPIKKASNKKYFVDLKLKLPLN